MFGDTMTMTLGGSGGTNKVMSKINQDGYQAEYYLNDGNDRYRAFVSHRKEGTRSGGLYLPVEQHKLIFRNEYGAGSSASPFGLKEITFQIRCNPTDTVGYVSDAGEAVALWATQANLLKLIGWES